MRLRQSGSEITDTQLLASLDTCLTLTPTEHQVVTDGMAKYVELGRLPKKQRDWCFAISRAKGLFRGTENKPRPKSLSCCDGSDNFSTRQTAGTAFAEHILQQRPAKPPMKRSA